MAHVGIQRLAARQRQENGAEHGRRDAGMAGQNGDRGERIERNDDAGCGRDVHGPEDGDDQEPRNHHRTEQPADPVRPQPLDGKQADQDGQGHRQDEGLKARRCEFQPLHRRQDRNRRRDDAIAIKQRRADYAKDQRP